MKATQVKAIQTLANAFYDKLCFEGAIFKKRQGVPKFDSKSSIAFCPESVIGGAISGAPSEDLGGREGTYQVKRSETASGGKHGGGVLTPYAFCTSLEDVGGSPG